MTLSTKPSNIKGEFLIHDIRFATARNGLYAKFVVSDASGSVKATKWNVTEEEEALLKQHDILHLQGAGAMSDYSGEYELNITYLNTPDGPIDLSKVIPVEPVDASGLFEGLVKLASNFQNDVLRQVTLAVLEDKKDYLMSSAAALKLHHAKPKGLLRHVTEMIKIAVPMCSSFNANSELVIAGIIFHDLAKEQEYHYTDYGTAKEMAADGVLFGHLVLGSKLPSAYLPELSFTEEIRMLEHIILSHHGKQEWGSPVTPATLEALIVHLADEASTRCYKMSEALRDMEEGEVQKVFSIGSVYRSPLGGFAQ